MKKTIDLWLENRKEVDKSYLEYIKNKLIYPAVRSPNIILAHLEKSEYNLQFSKFLLKEDRFIDWAVVGLYYALYHASLALLADKGYSSKDHNATICFIIRNYSEFSTEDIRIYSDLILTREEINFYTTLKSNRQHANYSTNTMFKKDQVEEWRIKSINFMKKVEKILKKG